jgi:hypothetical protein
MQQSSFFCLQKFVLIALIMNPSTSWYVRGITFSFPNSAVYTCATYCHSLGQQCAELATYDCLDAAKQVTHRQNTDELFSIKAQCSSGAGCFVDRFSLVRELVFLSKCAVLCCAVL